MGKHSNKNEEIKIDENFTQTAEIQGPTTDKDEYEQLCQLVNSIAHPLANRKLAKKIYKLIKKASQQKDYLKYGLVDVQKALRRNEKGFVILAGKIFINYLLLFVFAKKIVFIFNLNYILFLFLFIFLKKLRFFKYFRKRLTNRYLLSCSSFL